MSACDGVLACALDNTRMPDALGRHVHSLSALSMASAELEDLREDLSRAVRSVCPRWLADQADDLTQIAISRILDRVRATNGEIELSPGYLYRTAYSVVVDEIRRRRRRQEIPLESHPHVASEDGDPERQTFSREVRDAITTCLSKLSTPRRRAVTLHLLGHSLEEICAQLECRYKDATNLVYRGRSDLRACLRKRGVRA